jgi:hypothetical protein
VALRSTIRRPSGRKISNSFHSSASAEHLEPGVAVGGVELEFSRGIVERCGGLTTGLGGGGDHGTARIRARRGQASDDSARFSSSGNGGPPPARQGPSPASYQGGPDAGLNCVTRSGRPLTTLVRNWYRTESGTCPTIRLTMRRHAQGRCRRPRCAAPPARPCRSRPSAWACCGRSRPAAQHCGRHRHGRAGGDRRHLTPGGVRRPRGPQRQGRPPAHPAGRVTGPLRGSGRRQPPPPDLPDMRAAWSTSTARSATHRA